MAETEVLGIGEMRANFAKLNGEQFKTRIGRRMVVAGGTILKAEAKSQALAQGLRRTGALVKNIVIKREPAAPDGTVQYNMGVRHGANLTKKQKTKGKRLAVNAGGRIVTRYADDPFYWRFLEFSTRRRQGTPFLGPALVARKNDIVEAMGQALNVELAKVAA